MSSPASSLPNISVPMMALLFEEISRLSESDAKAFYDRYQPLNLKGLVAKYEINKSREDILDTNVVCVYRIFKHANAILTDSWCDIQRHYACIGTLFKALLARSLGGTGKISDMHPSSSSASSTTPGHGYTATAYAIDAASMSATQIDALRTALTNLSGTFPTSVSFIGASSSSSASPKATASNFTDTVTSQLAPSTDATTTITLSPLKSAETSPITEAQLLLSKIPKCGALFDGIHTRKTIVLVGKAGSGKSRLAKQIAQEWHENFDKSFPAFAHQSKQRVTTVRTAEEARIYYETHFANHNTMNRMCLIIDASLSTAMLEVIRLIVPHCGNVGVTVIITVQSSSIAFRQILMPWVDMMCVLDTEYQTTTTHFGAYAPATVGSLKDSLLAFSLLQPAQTSPVKKCLSVDSNGTLTFVELLN